MIEAFMSDPRANSLAVIVLVALVGSWILSLVLVLGTDPVPTNRSWYTLALPILTLLAIPAVLDLLQTNGLTLALALVFLMAIILNIVVPTLHYLEKSSHPLVKNWFRWTIPVLVIGGLAVAGYLAFVEVTNTHPVCGPLGHCDRVQASSYAKLFNILPVGILGIAGYTAIAAAWLVEQVGPFTLKKWAILAQWGMCIFGVLFSAYLTFLEPFVIGATCMWCISSAVLMILLLWVSTPGAQQALVISIDDNDE